METLLADLARLDDAPTLEDALRLNPSLRFRRLVEILVNGEYPMLKRGEVAAEAMDNLALMTMEICVSKERLRKIVAHEFSDDPPQLAIYLLGVQSETASDRRWQASYHDYDGETYLELALIEGGFISA